MVNSDKIRARDIADPDQYLEEVQRREQIANLFQKPIRLTIWLLAINILFWGGAKFYGMWLGDQGVNVGTNAEQLVFLTGMKINEVVAAGEWWRLVSSQYVHLNAMHLAFNGYGIWVVGQFLERAYGIRRMLVLYTATGVIATIASFFLTSVPSGGASGALYGLVGATIAFGIKHRKTLPDGMSKALTMGLMPWVVLGIGIGFLGSVPMDNAAHIGGLLSGAVLGYLSGSFYESGEVLPRGKELGLRILFGITLAVIVLSFGFWAMEALRCLGGPEDFYACHSYLLERR